MTEDVELGRRVRTAAAYAGLSQRDLGEELGYSGSTFNRMVLGARGLRASEQKWLIAAIAEKTGVPESFLTDGWGGVTEPQDDRLARVEDGLEELLETSDTVIAGLYELLRRGDDGQVQGQMPEGLQDLEERLRRRTRASRQSRRPGRTTAG